MTALDVDRENGPSLPRMVLWFALVTGLLELLVQLIRKVGFHDTLEMSRQIVWLTPASYLCFLALSSIGLYIVARLLPVHRRRPFEAGALAFLCGCSFFFLFNPRLAKYAILLIGVGIGIRVYMWVGSTRSSFVRVVQRWTPPMLTAVVLMGLSLNAYLWLAERRAIAAIGPSAPGAPNILLLILDTVRAEDLGLYGYQRPTTPVLTRLASKGVTFERAYSAAPWTLPSHASIFTGVNTPELTADWKVPLDLDHATIAEVLRNQGYATGGFVANFGYCSYEHGLARGFAHYEDYQIDRDELLLASSFGRTLAHSPGLRRYIGYFDMFDRKPAPEVNRELLAWTEKIKNRPYFAFLNYYDAHFPYFPPAPFDTIYGPKGKQKRLRYWLNGAGMPGRKDMTDAETLIERNAYDGAITYLDGQIGALLGEMDRRGLLTNTIVIITADHGEQFGEHDLYDHGNSLYLPLLQVPLIVIAPGATPGSRIAVPVGLRDLGATILDLAKVDGSGAIPGHSLVSLWRSGAGSSVAPSPAIASVRPARFSSTTDPAAKGEMYSVVDGRFHYILNGDGRQELYDVIADPAESKDLSTAYDTTAARLKGLLDFPAKSSSK
ncbi:MAG: sulfatase [Gemmatimonadota bacterium]